MSRLADARSPFLKHGAEQPVDWHPWGPEAFERARAEGKALLLDIGAVWCHWCHVMDAESYDDPATAALINELFVPVKVDRDESPDVDARYQRAVQVLTGQGGWPLTAFLTPDGDVFYGGTYFPPDERYGRPSFQRVLREVARVWRDEPEKAAEAAGAVRERLAGVATAESRPGQLDRGALAGVVEAFAEGFDFRWGGFGGAPKFPHPAGLALLLDRWCEDRVEWAARVVRETLHAMGRGGVHDQLGGGFHRYSTDARWRIPHFEKMAYDNGPLLDVYARAHAVFDEPYFAEVAAGIVAHYRDVAPELVAEGGFPASQDADVGPGDDGAYWTWTLSEARAALDGDERLLTAARAALGLDDAEGAMPHDPERRVPARTATRGEVARRLELPEEKAAALVADAKRRLKAARDARPRPYVDTTRYAGWVALVASGHLAAERWAGVADAAAAGVRALERLFADAIHPSGAVLRRAGDAASGLHLDDQVFVLQGCLDAFEWTQEPAWLARARDLADVLDARFLDADRGAFRDRPLDEPAAARPLEEPFLPVVDAPTPSGNGTAALALVRLADLTGEEARRERALGVLAAFADSVAKLGTGAGTWARALDEATGPRTTVVVVGGPEARPLLRAALAVYRPRTVVRQLQPEQVAGTALPPALGAILGGRTPRAYLCAGTTCAPPTADPVELARLMRGFRG